MSSIISKSSAFSMLILSLLLITIALLLVAENANADINFNIHPLAPEKHVYIVAIECNNLPFGIRPFVTLQQFTTSGKGFSISDNLCKNNMYHIQVSKLIAELPDKEGRFFFYMRDLYEGRKLVATNVQTVREEEVRDEHIAPGSNYIYKFGEAVFRGGPRFFELTNPTEPPAPDTPAFELKIHPAVEKALMYKLNMQCTNNYRMRHSEVKFPMVAYTFTDGKGDLLADNICGEDNKYEGWLSLVKDNGGRYEEVYKPESFFVDMAEAVFDEEGRKQYTLNFRGGHQSL